MSSADAARPGDGGADDDAAPTGGGRTPAGLAIQCGCGGGDSLNDEASLQSETDASGLANALSPTTEENAEFCIVATRLKVELVELSGEWIDGAGSADSDDTPGADKLAGRRTRHRNVARAVDLAEQGCRRRTRGGPVRPLLGILIFLAVNSRICTSIDGLLHMMGTQWFSPCSWVGNTVATDVWFGFFLTMDLIFLAFQVACVRRDRTLSRRRRELLEAKAFCRLAAFDFYCVVVLGLLSGWQLLRSVRQLRNPAYRDSFIAELSDPAMVMDDALRMPFFSSILAFLMEVPFVWRMSHVFAREWLDLCDLAYIVAWFLCFLLFVVAVLTLDYSLSCAVRARYQENPYFFVCVHALFRASESLCRSLVVGAAMLSVSVRHGRWVILYILVDYAAGAAAMCYASGGVTKRALFLACPMMGSDIVFFVDGAGVAQRARFVSTVAASTRALGLGAASWAYLKELDTISKGSNDGKAWHEMRVALCLLVMVSSGAFSAALACCVLRPRSAAEIGPSPRRYLEKELGMASPNSRADIFGDPIDQNLRLCHSEPGDLAALVFSKGVGDQFASFLEILWERGDLRLSRLEAIQRLGQGTFGMVLKVRDTRNAATYALKLQRRGRTSTVAVREAQCLHSLDHPYIVKLVHIFRTTAFYGILMELCDLDLNKRILQNVTAGGRAEGLPCEVAKHYAACMALGLEHLHQRSIIFRDLKPENVLTTAPRDCGAGLRSDAKLADFGLAKHARSLGPAREFQERSHWTAQAGTPAFMSEEASQPVPAASSMNLEEAVSFLSSRDWFAFGCCLLLTLLGERCGRRPMDGRILLPPPKDEIHSALRRCADALDDDGHALRLLLALTERATAKRAAGPDVRGSPFLADAIREAEQAAEAALAPTATSVAARV